MSGRGLYIHLFEKGQAANLYVVHFADREQNELEAFFLRENGLCSANERRRCLDGARGCRKYCRRQEYRDRLLQLLDISTSEAGFRPEFFRPFDKYRFPTCALQAGPYRLFGMRFDTDLFIAGSGGIKLSRRVQDDPVLDTALKDLTIAAQWLRNRMKRRGMDHPPRDERGLLHLPIGLIDQPFLPDGTI